MKILQGPYEIPIDITDKLPEDQIGEYEDSPPRIRVAEGLMARTAALVLIHEYVHHLSESYGLELSEQQTRVLEMGIGELFTRNPHVIRLLVQSLIVLPQCTDTPLSSPSSPSEPSAPNLGALPASVSS